MKNGKAPENRTRRRTLLVAWVTALAVASTVALPQAHGRRITPPPVPGNIQVEAGNKAFLVGHAVGTQNYICLPSSPPSPPGFAWQLFTPQANLFNDDEQVITHFFSPNPDEGGLIRPAWQHSQDTSTVWAQLVDFSIDPNFVEPGAIPWLLLKVVGKQEGPTGGDRLTRTTFIHRVNTVGGVAPSTGCAQATDVGKRAFVPYTSDYFFYKGQGRDDDDR